ncbi:MAG: C4-type zinc ribbon domain-containing protein [Caldilineaceae bacterium]
MIDVQALYNLQKIDVAWEKVRRRLMQIQKSLGETAEIKEKRVSAESTEQELHVWQTSQRALELESQSLKTRIQETDDLLMSGRVTNHKELEALQTNLEALRRHHTQVEEQTVEAFVKTDELSKASATQQQALEKLLTAWKSSQQELVTEGKKLKKQFLQLKQSREQTASAIDQTSMDLYEQLRKRKAGVAIAPIRSDNTCGACNMQAPTGIIQASQQNQTAPHICPFCGRILIRE